MAPKRKDASATIPASVNAASKHPSSAASSASSTSSPLKSSKSSSQSHSQTTTSSSSTTTTSSTTGGITFGHSSNTPYTPPPASSAKSTSSKGSSGSGSGSGGSAAAGQNDAQAIVQGVWTRYQRETPQRVKLVDAFMAFLVALGGVQFVYCVVAGNYPFNAFLSGFSATVGQFVLTASLRIQTTAANSSEFPTGFSDERAFADFVFGSLLLHFFCVNFIN